MFQKKQTIAQLDIRERESKHGRMSVLFMQILKVSGVDINETQYNYFLAIN